MADPASKFDLDLVVECISAGVLDDIGTGLGEGQGDITLTVGVTPSRFMASRQMVRTKGTVTTSRGSRNEYRISTLTPLLTAADEFRLC